MARGNALKKIIHLLIENGHQKNKAYVLLLKAIKEKREKEEKRLFISTIKEED